MLLHLLPFCRNLKGEFSVTPIWGLCGVERELGGVRSSANREPTHDFPIPLNTKCCPVCHCLAAIPISSYDPQFRRPHSGVRVDLGGRKWYKSKISSPHSYSTSIHTQEAYLAPFGHNTQRGSQTDRRQTVWRLSVSDRNRLISCRFWYHKTRSPP